MGDRADLRITRVDGTPVIVLRRAGREIAPDREVLVELSWMPETAPDGCGFRVA